jgi:exodeoxyribonuclease-5
MTIDLSSDQQIVYDRMTEWFHRPTDLLTVGGYAGTGKSTLLGKLIREERGRLKIACVAYTGKAANILKQKLGALSGTGETDVEVRTIHRLAYRPFENEDGDVRFKRLDRTKQPFDRFIVDEASMVSDSMFEDMQQFNVPILAIGDHGQLPPVNGAGTLMADPDLRLEKIHRQAESSPIIRIAHAIRENNALPSTFPEGILAFHREPHFKRHLREAIGEQAEADVFDTAVLTYTNATRRDYNSFIRKARWGEELAATGPQPGDVVICLRNDHMAGIFNGMRGVVESVVRRSETYYWTKVRFPDDGFSWTGLTLAKQFGRERSYANMNELRKSHEHVSPNPFANASKFNDLPCAFFDYGYAMTVHKSQGSQFKTVHLIMEFNPNGSADQELQSLWQRWAYTGVTRAVENLSIVDA